MLDKVPNDIFLNVLKFSELKECCVLKTVNKSLYNKVNNFQEFRFSDELKYIHHSHKDFDLQMTKQKFYNFINSFCKKVYLNTKKSYLIWMCSNLESCENDNINIKDEITKSIKKSLVFHINPVINNLLIDVVVHYMENDNVQQYPNKLNLLACYYFLKIIFYDNCHSKEFIIDFLDTIVKNVEHKKLATIYATNLITSKSVLTLDEMYKISKYSVSLVILKKLIGYKTLDLSNTEIFDHCNYESNNSHTLFDTNMPNRLNYDIDLIYDLITYKIHFVDHDLIGHNYNEIKKCIRLHRPKLYKYLINKEKNLIDQRIFVTHPMINSNINILSRKYKNLTRNLSRLEKKDIDKFIHNQRDYLYNTMFV